MEPQMKNTLGRIYAVGFRVERATCPFLRATSPQALQPEVSRNGGLNYHGRFGGKLPPSTAKLAVPPISTASLRLSLSIGLVMVGAALLLAGIALGQAAEPAGASRAWIRFDDAAQNYLGTPYRFLGDGALQLEMNARPENGDALALRWGAKNDLREAALVINGRTVPLRHGGYDGFQWWRVSLPDGISGPQYSVTLKASAGKPAFLGEIRLINERLPQDPGLDLKRRSFGVTLEAAPKNGEAFPEMRALWDRTPAPSAQSLSNASAENLLRQAERNARQAAEAFYRCRRFVEGWLAHADPKSGLIPRNLTADRDLWNGRDAAADNYPFMVLTCAFTDRPLFEGRMLEMLRTEIRLTSRLDRLCDDFRFSTQGFARSNINLDAIMFDNSEYVKDGLIPLTEWLGPSPWSERMVGIMEDVWKHAPVETPFGRLPTLNVEVLGDQLQACARLFWMTGERRYLDWGLRIGDYFLLGTHHPTRDFKELRLSDHGCEVVNGLSELYVATASAAPAKRKAYQPLIHEMLDRILAVGRNEDGMLYSQFNPQTGAHSKDVCDTWGYDYDAFYTVYLLDRTEAYREAVRKALGNLKGKYVGAPWGDKSADGYADSIEGAINLINREPVASAAEWIDSQIRLMWAIQKPDGIIEGWHGDGNGARTSILYALWKTQGAHAEPWRPDLRLGAVRDGQRIYLSLAADQPWSGRVLFDKPRHKLNMHLPMDYPRINQFPEWFITDAKTLYGIRDLTAGEERMASGEEMQRGVEVKLKAGTELRWRIQ